ncbi:MAG: hypothetical protein IAX21_05485 [Candidatus Bathyarchaeota archaeon]|nr:MAG: hypothetical protein IAX21_05485 [Candidatus Bathyarchaeota archaeon]
MVIQFIRRNAFWISASLLSLLVWVLRWIPESFVSFYNIVFISWEYYPHVLVRGSMYAIAPIGMISRLFAVILALSTVYLIWKEKTDSFYISKILAASICLEGIYYASLIPSILYLFASTWTQNSLFYGMLGFGYFLHVTLTFPFLTFLALKLYQNKAELKDFQSFKLIAITFLGYIIALWANASFRWIGLALTVDLSFLWMESTSLLAWNTIIFMTLAVVFASYGAVYLSKKKKRAIKWVGLALTAVGLHYLIYLIYHIISGNYISIWLIDVWAMALLGLGLSIIKYKPLSTSQRK